MPQSASQRNLGENRSKANSITRLWPPLAKFAPRATIATRDDPSEGNRYGDLSSARTNLGSDAGPQFPSCTTTLAYR